MQTVNIGIGVCDREKKKIVFKNRMFADLVMGGIEQDDYEAFQSLLAPLGDISGSPSLPDPIHRNGKILGYSVYGTAGKFYWIFIRDITEKMRFESIAEAVNISTNIGYIFSGVRHEIGNPVNSMKVAMHVLKDNFSEYSRETIMKYIDRTLNDIGRIEYLLQSLKNFNMHETQRIEDINLSFFMEKFLSLINNDFNRSGIDVKYKLYEGVEKVRGDYRALQQVFLNIVTNSADALEGREEPFILISVYNTSPTIQFVIEDNGCGIPDGHQKDLFKPFVTTKLKGTGLGLVIARKMLALMGGTIGIESHENVGSIVRITLPEGHGAA